MQLDNDYARELLLKIEAAFVSPDVRWGCIAKDDYKEFYTLKKLFEACFLTGRVDEIMDPNGVKIEIREMTYEGHKFLDTVRDDRVWEETKKQAHKFRSFSLELLGDLAKGVIRTQLKKATGVDLD